VERRPLAARIKWGNLARFGFALATAALLAWGFPVSGGPRPLPPDVGISPPASRQQVPAAPRPKRPARRAPGRSRKRAPRRAQARPARPARAPSPRPPASPPTAPAPAAGGEFGP